MNINQEYSNLKRLVKEAGLLDRRPLRHYGMRTTALAALLFLLCVSMVQSDTTWDHQTVLEPGFHLEVFVVGCRMQFARSITASVVQNPLGSGFVEDELSVLPSPFLRVNQTGRWLHRYASSLKLGFRLPPSWSSCSDRRSLSQILGTVP